MGPGLKLDVGFLDPEDSSKENKGVIFVIEPLFVKNTGSGFTFQRKTLHCCLPFIQKTQYLPMAVCFWHGYMI